MVWDPTQPPASTPLLSAPIRANFAALDTMLVAPVVAGAAQAVLKIGPAGDVVAAIPPGTNGHVLTLAAGVPGWAAPTGGSGGGGSDLGWLNTEDFPGADLGARFNAAMAVWAAGAVGGTVTIPPGVYTTATELVIPPTGQLKTLTVWAYGVTIHTTGAISGLRIQTNARQTAIYGLRIEHYNNATAVYGFNLDGSHRTLLRDCVVGANNAVPAAYAAVRIGFRTVGRQPSYWNTIENLWVKVDDGTSLTPIPTGILVEGASNVLRLLRCDLNTVTTGIHFRPQSDGTGVQELGSPGSILIDGCDFESVGTAIQFDDLVPSGNLPGGTRIVNNSVDNATTFLALDPALTGASANFVLSGNRFLSNVTNYCTRGTFPSLMTLDGSSTTPHLTDHELYGPVVIRPLGGSDVPLLVRGMGGNRGIHLETLLTGNQCLSLTYQGALSTHHADIAAFTGSVPGLTLRGVRGITGAVDGIFAKSLRGAVTISGTATEGVVTFSDLETDTSYFVTFGVELSASAPGVAVWIKAGSKTTAGFTIALSAAPGSGNSVIVTWMMMR